jgi:hypothetical protein
MNPASRLLHALRLKELDMLAAFSRFIIGLNAIGQYNRNMLSRLTADEASCDTIYMVACVDIHCLRCQSTCRRLSWSGYIASFYLDGTAEFGYHPHGETAHYYAIVGSSTGMLRTVAEILRASHLRP